MPHSKHACCLWTVLEGGYLQEEQGDAALRTELHKVRALEGTRSLQHAGIGLCASRPCGVLPDAAGKAWAGQPTVGCLYLRP